MTCILPRYTKAPIEHVLEVREIVAMIGNVQISLTISPRAFFIPAHEGDLHNYVVLLRHNLLWGECLVIGTAQHGHRDSFETSSTINRRRMVAIEFGT